MKKAARQARIRSIIEDRPIQTQEELADALRGLQIHVTQATVSRDIREMMLVKIPAGDGLYRYACPEDQRAPHSDRRMAQMFRELVTGTDVGESILVLRTLPGAASLAADLLDHAGWEEILGTVAGDNTVLAAARSKDAALAAKERLDALSRMDI